MKEGRQAHGAASICTFRHGSDRAGFLFPPYPARFCRPSLKNRSGEGKMIRRLFHSTLFWTVIITGIIFIYLFFLGLGRAAGKKGTKP